VLRPRLCSAQRAAFSVGGRMLFLLDTNVLSEIGETRPGGPLRSLAGCRLQPLRRPPAAIQGGRPHPREWGGFTGKAGARPGER
jgi:hypothetical protein